jgi:hypothetical protein
MVGEFPKMTAVGYPEFWDTARKLDPEFFRQTLELIPKLESCFGGVETDPLAKTVRAIAGIVCNSLGGITILALNGHGFEALLVARSMFEGAVTAAYLAKNPAEIADYLDFAKVSANSFLNYRKKYPVPNSTIDPNSEKRTRERFELVKGRYLRKNGTARSTWCRKSTLEMFAEVGLDAWYGSFYHLASAASHMNARGLYMSVEPGGENSIRLNIAPSEQWVKTSLAAARAAVLTALNSYYSIAKNPESKNHLQKILDSFSLTP